MTEKEKFIIEISKIMTSAKHSTYNKLNNMSK